MVGGGGRGGRGVGGGGFSVTRVGGFCEGWDEGVSPGRVVGGTSVREAVVGKLKIEAQRQRSAIGSNKSYA